MKPKVYEFIDSRYEFIKYYIGVKFPRFFDWIDENDKNTRSLVYISKNLEAFDIIAAGECYSSYNCSYWCIIPKEHLLSEVTNEITLIKLKSRRIGLSDAFDSDILKVGHEDLYKDDPADTSYYLFEGSESLILIGGNSLYTFNIGDSWRLPKNTILAGKFITSHNGNTWECLLKPLNEHFKEVSDVLKKYDYYKKNGIIVKLKKCIEY